MMPECVGGWVQGTYLIADLLGRPPASEEKISTSILKGAGEIRQRRRRRRVAGTLLALDRDETHVSQTSE